MSSSAGQTPGVVPAPGFGALQGRDFTALQAASFGREIRYHFLQFFIFSAYFAPPYTFLVLKNIYSVPPGNRKSFSFRAAESCWCQNSDFGLAGSCRGCVLAGS